MESGCEDSSTTSVLEPVLVGDDEAILEVLDMLAVKDEVELEEIGVEVVELCRDEVEVELFPPDVAKYIPTLANRMITMSTITTRTRPTALIFTAVAL